MTVLSLIERERARLAAALVGAGLAGGLAGAGAIAAAGGWLLGDARWLALPRALPWLLWGAILGAALGAAWWTRARLRREGATAAVARAVEGERSLRAGTVRGALEVGAQGPLGALAAADVAARLGDGPLAPALQRRARQRAAGAAVACVGALGALAAVGVAAGDGLAALAHPLDAARGALLPAIRFADAPSALVRGEPLALRVEAPGRRALRVAVRETGRPWRELDLPLDARGAAPLALGPADANVELVATDGRAHSDTLRVRVTDRAYLGDVTVRAEYPGYLSRASETLAPGEPLRVPRGTALTVRGRASVALRDVALADAGAGRVALATRGHAFEGRFVPEASGRWAWRAEGAAGPVGELPPALEVQLQPDSAPMVVLASPGQDSTIDGLAGLRARVLASDDHGLASVALRTWVERADGTRQPPSVTPLSGAAPAWTGEAAIEPAALQLRAGDKLHVQAVASDASPWRQVGVSREVVLKVPSASELRSMARASADSAIAGANALAAAQRDLQRRTGEAARSRTSQSAGRADGNQGDRQSQMGYQQAERARGLAQEQRQMAERTRQLQEQARALERQLAQAGALDSGLARQMSDVQQLLRDALTPELAKQLQSLERSAGSLSPGQARQSMEQLAQQQRELREKLERSAEMLKRAALEGAMQTLRDEAQELAGEQRKEAQRMEQGGAQQQAGDAAKSRELAQRSRELGKDIDQLGDRLQRERAAVGAERTAQAEAHADKSAEAMQRAAQAGERGSDPSQRRAEAERRDGSRAQNEERQGGAGEQGAQQRPQGGQQGAQQQGAQQQTAQGMPRAGQQSGQQAGGQPQAGGQQPGSEPQQGGQQQGGQQQGGQQGQRGDPSSAAREAANEMQAAADRLAAARQGQIDQWKGELSGQLDRAIQDVMQMAREQNAVERDARAGKEAGDLRGQQSAVQQGVDQAAQRLDQAGKSSSLLSQRAQRAMQEARQQVAEATQALQRGQQSGSGSPSGGQQSAGQQGAADAMREAGESLQRAAAALVRDRERVNSAASASGFEEMVEQLKQLAGAQGQINAQANAMPIPMPGAAGQGARDAMRQLARQQKEVAEQLEEVGEGDATGRADALAREARQLAQSLERAGADPSTLQRQQQLYRRLLEAGKTLEREERDESGKREAKSGAGVAAVAPADGSASGRAATKFPLPTWNELRALSAEERRLVLEYFRRLNGAP
jgi:hypothetical protein